MKILALHTDYIKFKALKKALKKIADLSDEEKKEQEIKEALVILTAVEKGDGKDIVPKYVSEIKNIAKQVNAKNIVLYPYAHLSSNLGSPEIATEVLIEAEKALKGFKVTRAPFGYYKEFELKVKGHPLSELSRSIVSEGGVKEKVDVKRLLKQISKSVLDTSKLKENDHRIIGKQMDLFSFHNVAPGMVFFHDNGLVIWNELIKYWREIHRENGYKETRTPQILDKKLWDISGHWEKFKNNMFLTDYEKREFAVKPMNCPGGMLIYKNSPKSYKDFPLRVAELGIVHRKELSGVLGGMFRLVQFVQDDAHIYCTENQIQNEVVRIMKIVEIMYSKFGLNYRVEFSTRPKKRIGSERIWDKAEKALESVLKKQKVKFKVNKGDGAFYGPKIDFHLKDSLGREWQAATIQLDMAMPERFGLEYMDKDNKKKRPIMIHRTILGGIERFYGILIEHFNGRFPTWLAPIQIRVLNFTDRNTKAAEKVLKKLKGEGIRVDNDFSSTTMGSKVKSAEIMRVPYIVTIGDKEEKTNTLTIRIKGNKKLQTMKLEKFLSLIKREILDRK